MGMESVEEFYHTFVARGRGIAWEILIYSVHWLVEYDELEKVTYSEWQEIFVA